MVIAQALLAAIIGMQGIATATPVEEISTTERRREYGVLPFIGGDTDIGLGAGLLGNVASLDPRYEPFKWRVEAGAFAASKLGADGDDRRVTFQDYYLMFVAPEMLGGRLRLEIRPSFTQESTLKYYGIGNASVRPSQTEPSRDFFGRTHPTLLVRARVQVQERFFVEGGASYTHNWLTIDENSKLAADLENGAGPLDMSAARIPHHGVPLLEMALMYDSRDQEIDPESGQFHALRVRASPQMGSHVPYDYQQVNVTTRFYLPLASRRITVATRLVGDLLLGDPPVYELARFEETSAIGGLKGVRGVPAQRYYGKVKLFGNLETRWRVTEFSVLKKPYILALVGFIDGGRLWSDLSRDAALDGSSLGLKYGVGGGVRVQRGKTFVVRADLAWSPDARPIGGYLAAGQMF